MSIRLKKSRVFPNAKYVLETKNKDNQSNMGVLMSMKIAKYTRISSSSMRPVEGKMPAIHLFSYCCGFLLMLGIVHSAAKTNPSGKGQPENEGVYYHSTPKEPCFHFSTTPVTTWSTLQCAVHCTSLKQTGFVMQKHLCQCITKRGIKGTDIIKIKEGSKVYIK